MNKAASGAWTASVKSAAEKPILRFLARNFNTKSMNNVAAYKLFCRCLHPNGRA